MMIPNYWMNEVEYVGELYGKVGGKHIPLGVHSSEIDHKDKKIAELLGDNNRLLNQCSDNDAVIDDLRELVRKHDRIANEYELQAEKDIESRDARIESLEDFVRSVIRWSEEYPETVFTEPTPEQVDDVCKTLGCRIDNIAAMILRGYTKQWARMASELLEGK